MFLKCNDKKIELHPIVWEYLYPYLLRFSIKHNIDWTIWKTKDVVYMPEDKKEEFIDIRRQRKSYENLKDKDYQKFLEKESKDEEKIIDEIVSFTARKNY